MPLPEGWVNTDQAADRSGYTEYHVRRLAQEGRIEASKVGREWLINLESLLEYKANVVPGRPKETD